MNNLTEDFAFTYEQAHGCSQNTYSVILHPETLSQASLIA